MSGVGPTAWARKCSSGVTFSVRDNMPRPGIFARRRRGSALGRLLGALVLLLVIGVVGVSVYVGWNLSHAEPKPVDQSPAALGLAYENIEFAATDGVTIRGWFLPAVSGEAGMGASASMGGADTTATSPYTIIFAHGFRGNRLEPGVPALELARSFVHDGFNVLMIDFRNHGESDGDVTTLGYHEVKDLYGAVQWLKQDRAAQAERIGVIGFSMGAVTSILAAANEPAIDAVVADSPFSDLRSYLQVNMPVWTGLPNVPFTWTILAILPPLIDLDVDEVSPGAVMPNLQQPVLLIHTDGDSAIPVSESERLAAAGQLERTELWVVSGERHVGARSVNPAAYDAKVIDFFRDVF